MTCHRFKCHAILKELLKISTKRIKPVLQLMSAMMFKLTQPLDRLVNSTLIRPHDCTVGKSARGLICKRLRAQVAVP